MNFKMDTSAVESKLNDKQENISVSLIMDNDTINKVKLLQKHYNVKNRTKLIKALIHGAYEAIK